MPQIRVQHFGPIVDSGLIEIKKNTFFIGNQGSGKSTMAKLISLMMWLEKTYNRGDYSKKSTFSDVIERLNYHGIHSYLKENTLIEYNGKCYDFFLNNSSKISNFKRADNISSYITPKISYVPAERNFLSVLSNAYGIKGLPENLFEFADELKRTQFEMQDKPIQLNLNNLTYTYNSEADKSFIFDKNHKINLTEASSGLQSYTPLFLVSQRLAAFVGDARNSETESLYNKTNFSVSHYNRMSLEIAKISFDESFSDIDRKKKIAKIASKFIPKCFINIVEEPEQNLFPDSQWEILKNLLRFNNSTKENKLLVTTHSPYIISFLSIAIQGAILKEKIKQKKENLLLKKLEEVVPSESLINENDVAIYQVSDNGKIKLLETFEGIPSDSNYLNEYLRAGNVMFDKLLEIEEELQ